MRKKSKYVKTNGRRLTPRQILNAPILSDVGMIEKAWAVLRWVGFTSVECWRLLYPQSTATPASAAVMSNRISREPNVQLALQVLNLNNPDDCRLALLGENSDNSNE